MDLQIKTRAVLIATVMPTFFWLVYVAIDHGLGRYAIGLIALCVPFVIIYGTAERLNSIQAQEESKRNQYKYTVKAKAEIASALTVIGLVASLWIAYSNLDMLNTRGRFESYSRSTDRIGQLLTSEFCESKPYRGVICAQVKDSQRELFWKLSGRVNDEAASVVGSIKYNLAMIESEFPNNGKLLAKEALDDLDSLVLPSESSRILLATFFLSLVLVFSISAISGKLAVAIFEAMAQSGSRPNSMTLRSQIMFFVDIIKK